MTPQQEELSRKLVRGNLADLTGGKFVAVATETVAPEWSRMIEMLIDLEDRNNGGLLLSQMPPWCRAERMPDGWLIEDLENSEFGTTLAEACAKMLVRRAKKKKE